LANCGRIALATGTRAKNASSVVAGCGEGKICFGARISRAESWVLGSTDSLVANVKSENIAVNINAEPTNRSSVGGSITRFAKSCSLEASTGFSTAIRPLAVSTWVLVSEIAISRIRRGSTSISGALVSSRCAGRNLEVSSAAHRNRHAGAAVSILHSLGNSARVHQAKRWHGEQKAQ